MTGMAEAELTEPGEPMSSGSLSVMFATPVARFAHPAAEMFNQQIAGIVASRLHDTGQSLGYKRETLSNITRWGEPVLDKLTRWTLARARQYVRASLPDALGPDRSVTAVAQDQAPSLVVRNCWASLYTPGDQHPPHYHPNTAITAIYYVQPSAECHLDLYDPRPNIDYYDPGVVFGGADRNIRLNCDPGDLVLFPGWLRHAVPTFTGDGDRISLSWNLDFLFTAVTTRSDVSGRTGRVPAKKGKS